MGTSTLRIRFIDPRSDFRLLHLCLFCPLIQHMHTVGVE